jgi:hypothetical protein
MVDGVARRRDGGPPALTRTSRMDSNDEAGDLEPSCDDRGGNLMMRRADWMREEELLWRSSRFWTRRPLRTARPISSSSTRSGSL